MKSELQITPLALSRKPVTIRLLVGVARIALAMTLVFFGPVTAMRTPDIISAHDIGAPLLHDASVGQTIVLLNIRVKMSPPRGVALWQGGTAHVTIVIDDAGDTVTDGLMELVLPKTLEPATARGQDDLPQWNLGTLPAGSRTVRELEVFVSPNAPLGGTTITPTLTVFANDKYNVQSVSHRTPVVAASAVDVSAFTAVRTGGTVSLKWKTMSEPGALGFRIWSSTAQKPGDHHLVTTDLVTARGEPTSYAISTTGASSASYWLELVDQGNTRRWVKVASTEPTRAVFLPVLSN